MTIVHFENVGRARRSWSITPTNPKQATSPFWLAKEAKRGAPLKSHDVEVLVENEAPHPRFTVYAGVQVVGGGWIEVSA